MELMRQWCDNLACRDYGKVGAGNIRVFSYAEQRYYCATCQCTFSMDKGTCFETVRSPHEVVLEVLDLLTERNSLRAVERLKHHSPYRMLQWLTLAGQHAVAVSAHFIRNLHVSQAQIDELWTFVKKSKNIVARMTPMMWGICGYGVPSHYPGGCGWSVT